MTFVSERAIHECITLAKRSSMTNKHGALILYKNGQVIGRGINHMISEFNSCHAEVAAIHNVKKNDRLKLKEATLLVIRAGSNGDVKMSKPCEDCAEFIQRCGIRRVIYST